MIRLWCGLAVCLCMSTLWAADDARLEGTVRDTSGGVAPDTVVTCLQEETGFRFSATSNGNGEYRFVVPEGHYKVVARHAGFRAVAQLGVFAATGEARRVDFTLEPGSIFETIIVHGAAGLAGASQAGSPNLPLDELNRAASRYASLTAPEVRAAFAKWIRPDMFVQVVRGPAPQ